MNRILFMGSPEFAASSLRALYEGGYNIVGVLTQPDKPKGRNYATCPTAVKTYALSVGLPVYTPQTLKDGAIAGLLDELAPDIITVVAYGKLLPEYVLTYPKYGCVNIHASLLPMYRGASPINFALIRGEKETGVTSMLMDKGLDTGDMLLKCKVAIDDSDNAGSLHDKLAKAGADLLKVTVDGLFSGSLTPEKQVGETFYAPLIDNAVRKLDFSLTAAEVYNKVRGLSPLPTAFTVMNGKIVKVYACEKREDASALPCGTLLSQKELTVKTSDGAVALTDIAPEGKRRMTGREYLAGLRITDTSLVKFE